MSLPASTEPQDSIYSSACSEDHDHSHTAEMAHPGTADSGPPADALVFSDLEDQPFHGASTEDSGILPPSTAESTVKGPGGAPTEATNGSTPAAAAAAGQARPEPADAGATPQQEPSGLSADHVEQELKQWEQELDGAELQEFEAEFQEFEKEMKPLTQQLDQLQKQLEAASLDPSMNQELKQIQQKLMQPPKPRQQTPRQQQQQQAEQQLQQQEQHPSNIAAARAFTGTSSGGLLVDGASPAVEPAAAAAAAAGKVDAAHSMAPEPATSEAIAAVAAPFAPENGEPPLLAAAGGDPSEHPDLQDSSSSEGFTTPTEAAGEAVAVAAAAAHKHVHEEGEQQQQQQQQEEEDNGEQQHGTLPRAGHHVRHASAISFGSIASDSQLESFGPGSDEDVTPAAAPADAARPATSTGTDSQQQQQQQHGFTPSAFAAAAAGENSSAPGGGISTSRDPTATAATATATNLHLSSSSISQAGSMEGSRGSPVHRQASYPLSPQAMSAVAPPALAPPRTDLDLRRLSLSSSPEGGLTAEGSGVDAWSNWAAHRRHFFVLTSAGKPVFSRHGDEGALAGGWGWERREARAGERGNNPLWCASVDPGGGGPLMEAAGITCGWVQDEGAMHTGCLEMGGHGGLVVW